MKSAVRNCACLQGMWATAVMSVVEGVFLPQGQQCPLLRLDPPLAPPGVLVLQEAKAQETVPEAGIQMAALEKISNPAALLSDIF